MEQKKVNPYLKRNRVEARLDNEELKSVIEKSLMYAGGNISSFVRMAILNYKPLTKRVVGK